MNIESFRNFCLSLPETGDGLPFGPEPLVIKVCGKMFALADIEQFESINLKCDPQKALALREQYPQVQPGYHMNKQHWNTIEVNTGLPDSLLQNWILDSYLLVVQNLKARDRERILAAAQKHPLLSKR